MDDLIPLERIAGHIHLLRGVKVMLDRDLASLYGVPTKALKQAVKRNISRFPEDFMFVLEPEEWERLRSQSVTSKRGGTRYAPMAFTEQGVAMLSSVLSSERAIQVNIQIMRTFGQMRRMLAGYEELRARIQDMEANYDEQFRIVFEALRQLLEPPDPGPVRRMGFVTNPED
ncbi:MAG: ORF6N domain-containing protein [Desulfarculus sp.]|nr:ORF6N domain-containing protein [Desulfarculus sp.]